MARALSLEGPGLAPPPAAQGEKRDERPQILGEMAEEGLTRRRLEEALAGVPVLERREDGALGHLADLHPLTEHPFAWPAQLDSVETAA